MVTDVFPALALGLGKGDQTVMNRPPADPSKPIVSNKHWVTISLYAAAMTLAVVAAVVYSKQALAASDKAANNVAFLTLAFSQLFHVFNMASGRSHLLVNEITRNKFVWFALLICVGLLALVYAIPQMRLVLGMEVLPGKVWLVSVVAGFIPLVLIQTYKIIRGRKD